MAQTVGTVATLMMVLRDCLAALAPHLPPVGIEWEEGKAYDDWDDIADALYSSIVASSVAYVVEGQSFERLTPYNLRKSNYADVSFLYCRELGRNAVFVKLQAAGGQFDTALFDTINDKGFATGETKTRPLKDLQFVAVLRSATGERDTVVLRES
jgi:hypothetical protein